MWRSHLTLQQTDGRTAWVAEGPHGGLAGGFCPIAPKLHFCSVPQPWPLPELCCRCDHAQPDPNLLTQLLDSTSDLTGYCRLAQWLQDSWLTMVTIAGPALLFLSHNAERCPSQQKPTALSVSLPPSAPWVGEQRQWRSEGATTAVELPRAGSGLFSRSKGAPQLKAVYRHSCNIAWVKNKGKGLNAAPEQRNGEVPDGPPGR